MANSAFDPLREDPFEIAQPPVVAITPVQSVHQNTQWGLRQQVPQGQQPPADDTQDILLQFNNANSHTSRRRADSCASGASSIGSRSARSGSRNDVLNDMTVAPPPERPVGKDYSRSAFHAEAEVTPVPPPNWDLVKHSGICLARISMRTLVMKKWKHSFWIAYGDHIMLFFKSRCHFDDWAMDPHLSARQREQLVKLRIDFRNPNFSTRKETENITGFVASSVKRKNYKSNGLLHQFKLDKWTNEGPTINAAFASNTREDVSELHLIVSAMIRKNLSAFISEHARNHSRAGEDSSGHYSTTDYSVGSNAQPSGDETRSAYSSRSQRSHKSGNSARSEVSTGSKNNYILNHLKAMKK